MTIPSEFVKCRVCGCGMEAKHAADHLATHRDAGDLIRAAHKAEVRELREEPSDD